jgi:hypothetical protein
MGEQYNRNFGIYHRLIQVAGDPYHRSHCLPFQAAQSQGQDARCFGLGNMNEFLTGRVSEEFNGIPR